MSDLILADRPIPDAEDALRRYCGLRWSGGEPEVWAYQYFDALVDDVPNDVAPQDVLAAAAVHPKLTRSDLTWFAANRPRLQGLLHELPAVDLAEADPRLLDALPAIAGEDVDLSLLSKVLHRKRPGLIPMLDRSLVGWYRLRLKERGAAAWPELVRSLGEDLHENTNQLSDLQQVVPLTHLRIADIAIWMEGHR